MTRLFTLILAFVLTFTVVSISFAQPLAQAHTHNDYEHDRPLLDALEHGFASVEADIWLVFGELFVAHNAHEIRRGRTLTSLYLGHYARESRKTAASTQAQIHR